MDHLPVVAVILFIAWQVYTNWRQEVRGKDDRVVWMGLLDALRMSQKQDHESLLRRFDDEKELKIRQLEEHKATRLQQERLQQEQLQAWQVAQQETNMRRRPMAPLGARLESNDDFA